MSPISRVREELLRREFLYRGPGFDPIRMTFLGDGSVGKGSDWRFCDWTISQNHGDLLLRVMGADRNPTVEFLQMKPLHWIGFRTFPEIPVSLIPQNPLVVSKDSATPIPIPKLAHFCWFSDEPMSDEFAENVNSWQEQLPDYEIIIWGNRFRPLPTLRNQNIFNEARNHGERADIFRYEILFEYGGIYLDLDCVPNSKTNFNDLLLMNFGQPAGVVLSSDWYKPWPLHNRHSSLKHIDICFMAASRQHPVLNEALSRLGRHFVSRDFAISDAHSRTGSRFLEVVVDEYCTGHSATRRHDGAFECRDVVVHCTDTVSQIKAGAHTRILHLAKGTWIGLQGWNWQDVL